MRTTIDPVTFAVVKHGLDAIVEEMAYTVLRTARSEIVKDVMDFSAAICDRDGRMIAQAKTIALHLGAVPEAMSVVLEHYADALVEGDAIILTIHRITSVHHITRVHVARLVTYFSLCHLVKVLVHKTKGRLQGIQL